MDLGQIKAVRISEDKYFNDLFWDSYKNYFLDPSYDNLKVGSINSIFYFLHKAAEPFNCLEQDNLTQS